MPGVAHSRSSCESRSRRTASFCEDVSLIILNHSSLRSDDEMADVYHDLVNLCFIKCCSHIAQCIKYFKKASSSEHIIVLLNHLPQHEIPGTISQLASYPQLQAIFLLCSPLNEVQNDYDSDVKQAKQPPYENANKLVKSFRERESMVKDLQKLILTEKENLKDHGLFNICNMPEKALKDLRKELGSFVWTHTFRSKSRPCTNVTFITEFRNVLVLLMAMPHNSSEAKRQMLRKCREIYFFSRSELANIKEFEKTYRADHAIRWYTRSCFLSKSVNKALRAENVYALYIFRYFIFDLCTRLEAIKYSQATPISLYRGTKLSLEEVQQLRLDSVVATNGFLSSSRDFRVAKMFTGSNENQSGSNEQNVLFQINVDLNVTPDVVVADISKQSYFPEENEFLFDLGTTFIITDIHFNVDESLWYIQMSPSNQVVQLNREYDAYIRERLLETDATILFGRMLAHVSEYPMAVKYFHRLLKLMPPDHPDRPNICYQLARMYRFLGKPPQAINYFQRAKLLQRRGLPQNRYEYGMTLAGLGTVYLELKDSKRAIGVLEQASIYLNLDSGNYNSETAFHLNRLSYAYYLEHQYEKALHLMHHTLSVYEKKMPVDHPGHAQAYHNLGLLHKDLGNAVEALQCYHEALRMRERTLAPNHPYIARTCYQIGLLYEDNGDRSLALEYVNKAFQIQEKKLPANHPELTKSKELIDRLSTVSN